MPTPLTDLTGNTRFRAGWFGKVVLQVEERYRLFHGAKPQPFKPTSVEALRWRDATPMDLGMIQLLADLEQDNKAMGR